MRPRMCAEQPAAAQQEGSALASDTAPQDEGFDADATPEDLLATTEVQEEEDEREELVRRIFEAEAEEEAALVRRVLYQDNEAQVGPHALAFT